MSEPDVSLEDVEFDPEAVRAARPKRRRARRREGALGADLVRELNRRPDVCVEKVQGTVAQGSGRPDLNGVVAVPRVGFGRMFKIELKDPDGHGPNPAQTAQLLRWQRAGALVGWATTFTEVDEILSRADDPHYAWTAGGGPGAP